MAVALLLAFVACSSPSEDAMHGIVVEVTGDLNEVEAFTVLVDGERVQFLPAPDGDHAFPLSHLQDHLRSGEPILVGWELVDGDYRATSIEDG
jgi:hypothetical protein